MAKPRRTFLPILTSSTILTSILACTSAQAGIELQSFQVNRVADSPPNEIMTLWVKFSYIENDEPSTPLLLDIGDGLPPVDLLTPRLPKNKRDHELGRGVPDTIIGADGKKYKSVFRAIDRPITKTQGSHRIRLIGGAPLRNDILNHDGDNVRFAFNQDLRPMGREGGVKIRSNDPDVMALEPGKKYSFDLPNLGEAHASGVTCRLSTPEESGLTSVPTIGENALRITKDCKVQWDTTGAQVGARYAFQYRLQDNDGREWVALSTIQIVKDLESICELTPSRLEFPAFKKFVSVKSLPWLIARVPNRQTKTIEAGPVGAKYLSAPGRGVSRWEQSSIFEYIRRDIAGTTYNTASSSYFDELPIVGPTYCPVVYELNCKGNATKDRDGDGVCDMVDNCPDDGSSANQWDVDGDGKGDICDSDSDGDGLPNGSDPCPNTQHGNIANYWGCSVQDLCPCPVNAWDWESKVACTRRESIFFLWRGEITREQRDAIIEQAKETVCPARKPFSWLDLLFGRR